jgi:hypothetical protein
MPLLVADIVLVKLVEEEGGRGALVKLVWECGSEERVFVFGVATRHKKLYAFSCLTRFSLEPRSKNYFSGVLRFR